MRFGDRAGGSSIDLMDEECERSEGVAPFVSVGVVAMTYEVVG